MCRKQLPITYSTYMEQCAFSLQEDSEVDTDKTLIHFIKLLRIMNEIYSVFEYGDPDHVFLWAMIKFKWLSKLSKANSIRGEKAFHLTYPNMVGLNFLCGRK